jgi:hypothetical protein
MSKLPADQRRALNLLVNSANGCAESVMLAFGITKDVIAKLLITRLAESEVDRRVTGEKGDDLWRVRITDAGRRALK